MNWLRRNLVAWLLPEIVAQQGGKSRVQISVCAAQGVVHGSELASLMRDIRRRGA